MSRLAQWLKSDGHDTYLGVHSRLDVGTSGVLPFTTSRELNAAVAEEIERGAAERVYVAAVSFLGAAASPSAARWSISCFRTSAALASCKVVANERWRVTGS